MEDYNKEDIKKHLEWYFMNEGEISGINCVPQQNEYDLEDHIQFRLTVELINMDLPASINQAVNVTSTFSYTIHFGIDQIFWQGGAIDCHITPENYDKLIQFYRHVQNEIPPKKAQQH